VSSDRHSGSHLSLYLGVFVALLGLTWLTVWVSGVDLGVWNTPAALSIASLKASLVLLFFMHLWWSSRLTWIFAVAGLFFLLVLISLTLADFLSRDYLQIYG
jgi:cytochrome c oxidase subunit 4